MWAERAAARYPPASTSTAVDIPDPVSQQPPVSDADPNHIIPRTPPSSAALLDELAQLLPAATAAGQDLDPALVRLLCPPLIPQPAAQYTAFTASQTSLRYFQHYLTVIMPYQWLFERRALADLVAPLAYADEAVFESLVALGALHVGSRRALVGGAVDTDTAQQSLQRSIASMAALPPERLGRHETIVAAMSISSFYLFAGGNRSGWPNAVRTCRACLSAVQHLDPGELGHLLSPLAWTDILASVTEGRASAFISLYRRLLAGDTATDDRYLRETVMGCDSTTRLAIAETVALSEWKDQQSAAGCLSVRELLHRSSAIERLLSEREAREHFDDPARRLVADVFYHGSRVLLATVVDGCYPYTAELASAVADVLLSLSALDAAGVAADRALVFPITISGCHAQEPQRAAFAARFHRNRLGPDADFGNTRNALRLMHAVWARRDAAPPGEEVHWRRIMHELDPAGLLLI
ncbi:hypothetical protein A1Q2_00898 [Trichosporon asahii var. asahii CBS 8904]|uniref:Uncharacterized protein n=1 Tax=Trichosporon asahii var. asahii (strain CBS 8904) TaxID=1220162 RepID=K1VYZ9_TRIAC|nr:hypothetical protein A1Q2_00898 [Trichosporon asahii var. asahii CBS 8904]